MRIGDLCGLVLCQEGDLYGFVLCNDRGILMLFLKYLRFRFPNSFAEKKIAENVKFRMKRSILEKVLLKTIKIRKYIF